MVNNQLLEEIIRGLNVDLAWEYAATVQYIQHASMLHGPEYLAVIEELEEHAKDEHDHAVVVSNMIQYLGGIPTVEVETRLVSEDNQEMLLQDLQWEYDTISRYIERIHQLESLGLYDLSQQIREIASEEQHHAHELEVALGVDRKTPSIPHLDQVYPVPPQEYPYQSHKFK